MARRAARSSAATSNATCSPSRTLQRPSTMTWRTSAGRGGEDDGRDRLLRARAGEADAVERDGGEVGERAGLDAGRPPASRARRSRSPSPRAAGRSRRCTPRTPVASRSSSSIARASSNGSMTACESLPVASEAPASSSRRAGPMPSARSRSVVGQRQAVTPAPPSSATSSSVRWVAWTAVKRSDSAPASASSPVGVRPCAARHSSFSFGCSETCACSGRPAAHAATIRADSGSTARTLWIAAPTRAVGRSASRVHALGPGAGVGVAEARRSPPCR